MRHPKVDGRLKATEDTVTARAWFIFTLQPRREPGSKHTSIVQMTADPMLVTMDGVPAPEVAAGWPSQRLLWEIEDAFAEAAEDQYPGYDVICWEGRWNDPQGPLLSSFRDLLPADGD